MASVPKSWGGNGIVYPKEVCNERVRMTMMKVAYIQKYMHVTHTYGRYA